MLTGIVRCRVPLPPSRFQNVMDGLEKDVGGTLTVLECEVRLPLLAPEASGFAKLSHILSRLKCPAGVEPARPPWPGGRLPLHHGHTIAAASCQRESEHRVGLEPVTRHQVGSRNPDTRFDRTCSSVRVYGPKVTVVQKRKRAAASEPIQPAEGQRQPLWVLRCRRTDAHSRKEHVPGGPAQLQR